MSRNYKLFCSFMLLSIMLSTLSVPSAFAKTAHATQPDAGKAKKIYTHAVLVNSKSKKQKVIPVEIVMSEEGGWSKTILTANVSEATLLDNEFSAGQVGTTSEMRILDSGTINKWDSSSSVKVSTTTYWSELYSGGQRYISVSNFQTNWTRTTTQVSASNTAVSTQCASTYLSNGQRCNIAANTTINPMTWGTGYIVTPSWQGQYIQINDLNFAKSVSYTRLTRGTTSWDLYLVTCFGGGSVLSCNASF